MWGLGYAHHQNAPDLWRNSPESDANLVNALWPFEGDPAIEPVSNGLSFRFRRLMAKKPGVFQCCNPRIDLRFGHRIRARATGKHSFKPIFHPTIPMNTNYPNRSCDTPRACSLDGFYRRINCWIRRGRRAGSEKEQCQRRQSVHVKPPLRLSVTPPNGPGAQLRGKGRRRSLKRPSSVPDSTRGGLECAVPRQPQARVGRGYPRAEPIIRLAVRGSRKPSPYAEAREGFATARRRFPHRYRRASGR